MAGDRPSFRRTSGVGRSNIIETNCPYPMFRSPRRSPMLSYKLFQTGTCSSSFALTPAPAPTPALAPAPALTPARELPTAAPAPAPSNSDASRSVCVGSRAEWTGPSYRRPRPSDIAPRGRSWSTRLDARAPRVERWVSGHEPTKNARSYASTRARRAAVCARPLPRAQRGSSKRVVLAKSVPT